MNTINVMYVTEEEKKRILDMRMEQERKANRKRMTAYEMEHRIAGIALLVLAVLAYLVFGMESIVICIMCGLFAIMALCAREEDRKKWADR